MSVEVRNLTKIYGQQRALDGISFSVEQGQVLGFLGPNGAGKSTTMKIATGYYFSAIRPKTTPCRQLPNGPAPLLKIR